ncbi:MAG: HlyD family secretion protein [Pseudomonadales bacterium]
MPGVASLVWIQIIVLLTGMITGCEQNSGAAASLGTLERDRIELVAESNEPITRVLVEEGDPVAVGAIVIQQDTARAEVALARARAEEAVAHSALAEAEKGPRQQHISQARARLSAASSAVKTARIELDRELSLVERQLAAQNRVDLLQGRYDEATARQREARAALDELLEGTRSEAIDQARSLHASALASVQDLEITLHRAATRSPVTGAVEALPFEIGERPPFGATVAVILAGGRTYARVHVSESLREHLSAGAAAEVWLDSRDVPLAGKLRWIAADAAFTPYFALNQHDRSRLSYLAEIDLDSNDLTLPIGVPVEVTFPGLVD